MCEYPKQCLISAKFHRLNVLKEGLMLKSGDISVLITAYFKMMVFKPFYPFLIISKGFHSFFPDGTTVEFTEDGKAVFQEGVGEETTTYTLKDGKLTIAHFGDVGNMDCSFPDKKNMYWDIDVFAINEESYTENGNNKIRWATDF